ncbi:uncharacterized protein LOC124653744 [Lolium rigidum]|uniref:uncharacterized protein LOC124653744 n=1 Tax=Lolium rigidum TaxID=89674 RepID=UPI001F5D8133|nr:uncharacterized protein LOC124653744 [Lolium rigidum]
MEKVRRILKWWREKKKHARAWPTLRWHGGRVFVTGGATVTSWSCRRDRDSQASEMVRPRESRRQAGDQVLPSLLPLAAVARHDTGSSGDGSLLTRQVDERTLRFPRRIFWNTCQRRIYTQFHEMMFNEKTLVE